MILKILSMFLFAINALAYEHYCGALSRRSKSLQKSPQRSLIWRPADMFVATVYDILDIHKSIFSVDTAKILTACTPWYLMARRGDHHIQDNFYDSRCHKNINQCPSAFANVVEKMAFVGVVVLSSFALFSPDFKLRTTSRVFSIGAWSGLLIKDCIKNSMKTCANLRPWHENFSKKKRSFGGFPSGHVFEAIYMTTVYGLQYGLKAGIPLGIFSGAMIAVSINGNRHYASQVVAGIALGLVYGVAAHHVINQRISASYAWCVGIDEHRKPYVGFQYSF